MTAAHVATRGYTPTMRDHTLRIRVTPDELAALDKARGDVTRSVYVRRRLFGSTAPQTRGSDAPKPTKPPGDDPRAGTCMHQWVRAGKIGGPLRCRACGATK